jgi:alkanesulfonate monooxygenase SsuD/methylene tetrahydromethanopterin reductase-like flavin-dependent oxidoreductase (luciferase family)
MHRYQEVDDGCGTVNATLRSAVWVPLFDALSDPLAVARLAARAEEAGWHGFFVWDHVNWRAPITSVADPWVTLTAIATATESLTLGPMVTPLARRRPVKVARETATLDRLSGGRLVLGAGLGDDRFGNEFSKTGDELDGRVRGEMLDEALTILPTAWSGQPVRHRGRHYIVDDITFLPRPVQPTIPIWIAGFPGNVAPLRRAAHFHGYFPVNLESPEQVAHAAAVLSTFRENRTPTEPFDIVVACDPGADVTAYADAGATWLLTDFDPEALTISRIRAVIDDGPPC